jgi:hypothetical protein
MRELRSCWKLFCVLALAVCGVTLLPDLCAQAGSPVDLEAQRIGVTMLEGPWRFHAGDDARWARAEWDDSGWKAIDPSQDWMGQGYGEENHMAWFRFRLRPKGGSSSVILALPAIPRSYQLYADGVMVGQVGKLPPEKPEQTVSATREFTLPVHGETVAVALRMWEDPLLAQLDASQLDGPVYAGGKPVLEEFELRRTADLMSDGMGYTQNIVQMVVGAAALLLFLLVRERVYAWFAVSMAIQLLDLPINLLSQHFAWERYRMYSLSTGINLALVVAEVFFICEAVQVRKRWQIALPIALGVAANVSVFLALMGKLPLMGEDMTYSLCQMGERGLLIWYLVRGWRKGLVDAKLLLIPFTLLTVNVMLANLGSILLDFGVAWGHKLASAQYVLVRFPFHIALDDVDLMLVTLGLLAVLVLRFARTSRERQRLVSALAAAHEVQSRLLPMEIPSLGGLRTEIVSLAAEEVGGDFCQVLPRANGSILVAIGDVSGKGLQAAMVGALAVGALRSLADEAIEPAAALERLNEVLLRTENKGFITCLCMELTPEGAVTVANAGHLAPYLNGAEVDLPAGLPLGLVRGMRYEQRSFRLPAKARLTLLSDGVVEARSGDGELYGFERTQEASQWAASKIAGEAQRHGQEDDITVITLDWAEPVLAA